MKHEVVFIDWAGTLSSSPFWARWQDAEPEKWDAVQRFFATNPTTVVDWMRGNESAESISAKIGAQFAISESEVFSELKDSCIAMELIDSLVLDSISQLRDLGVKVVLATDNMDTFQRWTVPAMRLKLHFDDILDSYSLKTLKADVDEQGQSAFFLPYLNALGVKPQQAILFDDNAPYIKEFGLDYRQVTDSQPLEELLRNYLKQ